MCSSWWSNHVDRLQDEQLASLNFIQQQNRDLDIAQQKRIERLERENLELKVYVASLAETLLKAGMLKAEDLKRIADRVDRASQRANLRGDAKPVFNKSAPASPELEDPNPATRPRRRLPPR
jgi:hypothetical protein